MNRAAIERMVIGVLVAGFAIGTTTHLLHLVNTGWIVFDVAPTWMNVYWTMLTVLDPLAAVLLIVRRRLGLALGAAIILSDVAINSYALLRARPALRVSVAPAPDPVLRIPARCRRVPHD